MQLRLGFSTRLLNAHAFRFFGASSRVLWPFGCVVGMMQVHGMPRTLRCCLSLLVFRAPALFQGMRGVFRSSIAVLLLQAASWSAVSAVLPVVKEIVSGTIFRKTNYVTVDQYTLSIAASSAIVEIDMLSMETADNVTFTDVNSDCDSAYFDPQVYLFQKNTDGSLTFVASNDDAGDDNPAYASRGRTDGSVTSQDSYLIRQLSQGTYLLAVGRYPLSQAAAAAGQSTDSVDAFTPYVCMARKASYGNYKMTVRTQSSVTSNTITKKANSYVGNSCNVSPSVTAECVYYLPANIGSNILKTCSYDKTIY